MPDSVAPRWPRPLEAKGARASMEYVAETLALAEGFMARVLAAEGDVMACADLLAEAAALVRQARGFEVIGRDGRAMVCIEELKGAHMLDAARAAYERAREGRNV